MMDLEIFDLDIFDIIGKNFCFYVCYKILGIILLSFFGDGVCWLLFMVLIIVKLKDGILLIDELEIVIYIEVLFFLFFWLVKWCRKMNVQLFVIIYSLEIVDVMLNVSKLRNDLVLYCLY